MKLDPLIENHLDLQVKISYPDHHDFLIRHGLKDCASVLDVGTGNGTFVARLAQDHPRIHFVGIDKRKPCIESCKNLNVSNFDAFQLDMFSQESQFDFSRFDGFLMRYFLLHVDHTQKILNLFKSKSKKPSKFWVIDLDWSHFQSEPKSPGFDKLTNLVKDFCSKVSIETLGGKNVVPLLEKTGFQNIKTEVIPFSSQNVEIHDFALYLKQEILCYSRMSGRGADDHETAEILRFIDEDVLTKKVQVSYSMILISAELI